MPRARNKDQLLEFGKKEFEILMIHIKELDTGTLEKKELFKGRTIKDTLAHLHAWHTLFFTWYADGMAEKELELPAPGYTWKDTPKLNEALYKQYKGVSLQKIVKDLKASHKKVMNLIKKHSDTELTEKKKYAWTGSTNLASYLASATSSHYVWANELIRKMRKGL